MYSLGGKQKNISVYSSRDTAPVCSISGWNTQQDCNLKKANIYSVLCNQRGLMIIPLCFHLKFVGYFSSNSYQPSSLSFYLLFKLCPTNWQPLPHHFWSRKGAQKPASQLEETKLLGKVVQTGLRALSTGVLVSMTLLWISEVKQYFPVPISRANIIVETKQLSHSLFHGSGYII